MDSKTEQSIQLAFVFNKKSQAIVAVHSSPAHTACNLNRNECMYIVR